LFTSICLYLVAMKGHVHIAEPSLPARLACVTAKPLTHRFAVPPLLTGEGARWGKGFATPRALPWAKLWRSYGPQSCPIYAALCRSHGQDGRATYALNNCPEAFHQGDNSRRRSHDKNAGKYEKHERKDELDRRFRRHFLHLLASLCPQGI
jgi:hypothetical protein